MILDACVTLEVRPQLSETLKTYSKAFPSTTAVIWLANYSITSIDIAAIWYIEKLLLGGRNHPHQS